MLRMMLPFSNRRSISLEAETYFCALSLKVLKWQETCINAKLSAFAVNRC